jgi:hypothetical protein
VWSERDRLKTRCTLATKPMTGGGGWSHLGLIGLVRQRPHRRFVWWGGWGGVGTGLLGGLFGEDSIKSKAEEKKEQHRSWWPGGERVYRETTQGSASKKAPGMQHQFGCTCLINAASTGASCTGGCCSTRRPYGTTGSRCGTSFQCKCRTQRACINTCRSRLYTMATHPLGGVMRPGGPWKGPRTHGRELLLQRKVRCNQ